MGSIRDYRVKEKKEHFSSFFEKLSEQNLLKWKREFICERMVDLVRWFELYTLFDG